MVKKTTTPKNQSRLLSWLFSAPARFAVLSFASMMLVAILYAMIASAFGANSQSVMYSTPLFILMLAALIFSVCLMIKWLPKNNLDRRSFVAVDNGLTIIYFISFLVSTLFLLTNTTRIMYWAMWLQYQSMFLLILVGIIAAIIYLYICGLMVSNMYATYKRAITMGVPRWKAILSFPFTFVMLWLPGYLLADETKGKPAIETKTKWYSAFTDWVVAKPINAILIFLFTLIFSALFFDIWSAYLTLFFAIMFGVWVWVAGAKTLRKNVGGAYATVSWIANIVLWLCLISAVTYFTTAYRVQYENAYSQPTEYVVYDYDDADDDSDYDY